MSKEALLIAEERRDEKSKGEKERYIHLNAEFQKIARRGKKAFPSDQCKKKRKIEETVEWEKLDISSRKLEIQGDISCKDGHKNKGQKQFGPNRHRRD